jgi:hypothetical protein
MRKRFKVSKFAGRQHVLDTTNDKVFGFGPGFDWFHMPFQQHRAMYTEVDAIHLTEWLNERAAGYPTNLYANRSHWP